MNNNNLAGYFLNLILGLLNLRSDLPHLPHQSSVICFRLLPELVREYLLCGPALTTEAYLDNIIIDQRYLPAEYSYDRQLEKPSNFLFCYLFIIILTAQLSCPRH